MNPASASWTHECPSEEELERFLAGELNQEETQRIDRHLHRCKKCERFCDAKLAEVGLVLETPEQVVQEGGATVNESDSDATRSAVFGFQEHFPQAPVIPDYELRRRLGRGTFGEVWLAENRNTGVYHAVKLIPPHVAMHIERQAISDLERLTGSHAWRVDIRHVGRTEACLYYVMELADSYVKAETFSIADYEPRTLEGDLKRRGRLPVREAVEISIDVLEGLKDLHAHGLLHRDVKPANVVFIDGRPRLGDLGLVARAADEQLLAGTPKYAPPGSVVDHSGDLYCVGRMLLEMIAGDLPDGPLPNSLSRTANDSPAENLTRILDRATAVKTKDRFQTAEQLQNALRNLIDTKESAPVARRRTHWLVVTAAILMVVAGTHWALRSWRTRPSPLTGHFQVWVEPARGRSFPQSLNESVAPLKPGQKVQIRLKLERPAYPMIALVSPDPNHPVQIAYPRDEDSANQQPVTELELPPNGAWQLTSTPGMLSFVALARNEPVEQVGAALHHLEPLAGLPVADPSVLFIVQDGELKTRRNPDAERPRGFPSVGVTVESNLDVLRAVRARLAEQYEFVYMLVVPQTGSGN